LQNKKNAKKNAKKNLTKTSKTDIIPEGGTPKEENKIQKKRKSKVASSNPVLARFAKKKSQF
jgi:hypothetical protein